MADKQEGPRRNGADVLVDTLIAWGIDTIYGLPGDGINGVMEAIRLRSGSVRFVQVRHEESAAFMACAHAKWTGRLGCCLATTGPGGVHLLNGPLRTRARRGAGARRPGARRGGHRSCRAAAAAQAHAHL